MALKAFNKISEDRRQVSNELLVQKEHIKKHVMTYKRLF
jgi:hypothetical protein